MTTRKVLTQEAQAPFIAEINAIAKKYNVMITAHCIWLDYSLGSPGAFASHCFSNATDNSTAAMQAGLAVSWYRDGKLGEHHRQ